MEVRDKIKLLRSSRKWSREYLAEQLGMSSNGYGALERGDSEFTLDKLEKLSELFEMSLNDLVDVTEKNIATFTNHDFKNQGHQGNAQFQINHVYSSEYLEIKHELEKQILINEMQHKSIAEKDEQIVSLRKIIELLEQK
jgi:transcriptional regulator with XRE-family HTH domain